MAFDKARFEREARNNTYQFNLACGLKVVCPSCNQKTFVPYMDKETYEILEDKGRCDREAKCGHYSAPNSQRVSNFISRKKVAETPFKMPDILDMKRMMFTDYLEYKFLTTELGKFLAGLVPLDVLTSAIVFYNLGRDRGGEVFPTHNANGRLARFKHIRYGANGKRTKYISYQPKGDYAKGIFGFYNVANFKKVFIVESEKSAIVGFIAYYLKHGECSCWIATGGTNGLTPAYIEKLKHKECVFMPDCDEPGRLAFSKYYAKLVQNSTYHDLDSDRCDGYDIADKIIEQWQKKRNRAT